MSQREEVIFDRVSCPLEFLLDYFENDRIRQYFYFAKPFALTKASCSLVFVYLVWF